MSKTHMTLAKQIFLADLDKATSQQLDAMETIVKATKPSSFNALMQALKGGPGSGDHGHSGRPGKRGGSSGGKGGSPISDTTVKLLGNKEEAATYMATLTKINGAYGGAVGKFLESNPVTLAVGSTQGMGSSDGVYNQQTKKITLKPVNKAMDPSFLEEKSSMTVIQGQKLDSKKAMMETAFAHELGHHVELTMASKSTGASGFYKKTVIDNFQTDNKKVSTYAGTHPHEYFAESFAAYALAPQSLSPTAKRMIESTIKQMEALQ